MRSLGFVLLLLGCFAPGYAAFSSTKRQAPRIGRVIIKGNKIIETSIIRDQIQLKKGSFYNKNIIQQDVRNLFSLHFFETIEVHKRSSSKGLTLVYQVKERLPVDEVEFKGNKHIKAEDLMEISSIKEHSFLSPADLQKTIFDIQERYKEKAYYFAQVSYKTEKIPKKNKFKLIFNIQENKKLFIKKIHFIGNRNILSRKLKAYMLTKEKNLFSFLSSSAIFKPAHVERDMQFIEYYYRDKGYLNVHVAPPEIRITPDKRFLYIQFSISEGPRFKMGTVIFEGDKIVAAKDVKDKFHLKKSEYFSLSQLHKDMKKISVLYKDKGYAFARAKPQFFPDKMEQNKIHIVFQVEKDEIYKVNRILTSGNKATRDKVFLRRFRIKEGDIYNESKKELTHQLIQQLGYFETVDLTPVRSPTQAGTVDLLLKVKERENTGEAHIAGGYSSGQKLMIKGGVRKPNFLGLEQSIALQLSFSKYEEIVNLSYQIPYFMDSSWNLGLDFFNIAYDTVSGSTFANTWNWFSSSEFLSYFQLNTGFSMSLGRPITDFSTVYLKYRLQNQKIDNKPIYTLREWPVLSPVFGFLFGRSTKTDKKWWKDRPDFSDIYDLKEGIGLNSSISAIWEYDKRNNRYYASRGFFTRLSLEYSGLGGDFKYSKFRGNFNHYYPLFWKLVLKNRLAYGWVGSPKKIPFTELFLLGGPYNLRGFQTNTLGPVRRSQNAFDYAKTKPNQIKNPEKFAHRPYGGKQMFFYNLELEFPIVERAEFRGAVFFDIGEANDRLKFNLENHQSGLKGHLRANVGFGLRWRSPFGPLSLDWAFPYRPNKEKGEESWKFHFSFGAPF